MLWSILYLASEWVIRLAMLVYVPRQRSAAAARAWLLLIFLLPWPGLVCYALVGRIYLPRYRLERHRRAWRKIRLAQSQMQARRPELPQLSARLGPLAGLAARIGNLEPSGGNRVELLTGYTASLNSLVEDIAAARRHVHLLYYIFGDDAVGRRVADALAQAAARGVQCRVLMDAVGSKRALRRLAPGMRARGIEVREALPVGLFRRNAGRFDQRNHRKIAVIDGRIGYTGSQNIADGEFVPGFPNEELVARIEGPAAAQLQAVFLADHYAETSEVLGDEEMFPQIEPVGKSIVQVVLSGPGYGRESGHELLVTLLYSARERVVLTTPYFVPNEPFLEAVCSAARRGVSVRLVVSQHANQLLTQLAQRSFYDELLEAGVRIHLYRHRFLHAKHFTIDDDIAVIGSSNIDIRSFALNAEANAVFYDPDIVDKLRRIQQRYFTDGELLSRDAWARRPLGSRVLQGVARLADSLL